MKAKLLIVTDLHKRDVDLSTILGYTKAVDQVQLDLIQCIKEHGVTHCMSAGDWYDKGYRTVHRTFNDRNLDEEIARAVNGEFYLCIGNHLFLERDSNPEMYLIQPHPEYKPSKPVIAFRPLMRTPKSIKIGTVQISFFHYDKDNKNYRAERDPDTTFHIGIYHDHTMVPSSALAKAHADYTETSSSYISSILESIDLAIVGHIHTPIGLCKVAVNDRVVPMIIPGSLAICKNSPWEIHSSVDLPMITIEDDNSIKFEYVKMSLHTELLTFKEGKDAKKASSAEFIQEAILQESSVPKSFTEFLMTKTYPPNLLELVEEVGERSITVTDALGILNKEVSVT